MWGFAPVLTKLGRDMGFVPMVITSCIVLYVAALFWDRVRMSSGVWDLLTPTYRSLAIFGASGYVPVAEYGRWWTVLTASWLHANLIHIALNMMSVRNVAPIVSEFYGASRMIIILCCQRRDWFCAKYACRRLSLISSHPGGRGVYGGSIRLNLRPDRRGIFLRSSNGKPRSFRSGETVDPVVSVHGFCFPWNRQLGAHRRTCRRILVLQAS
jgi:hypothetical protein